jgi:hypothetical protein
MTLQEQGKYLFERGECIGVYEYHTQKKMLYSVNRKFYEVTYLPKENVIGSVERCDSDHAVKFYSNEIDMSDLL